MLTRDHRLTSSRMFGETVRRGVRAGGPRLVLHLAAPTEPGEAAANPPQAGFVVSRAVGSAVVRNRVKRRLRHLVGQRLCALPESAVLVVRALPASADASYQTLGADLDSLLRRLRRRLESDHRRGGAEEVAR